ncbi:hypothetical protein ILYODFUR_032442 [Ilyodon furcidens]|uniref:Uncharacterized protein n=1 Tax=Ilyodon furcidens TaxID=33524 RepID=A0ABV0U062_9TELE
MCSELYVHAIVLLEVSEDAMSHKCVFTVQKPESRCAVKLDCYNNLMVKINHFLCLQLYCLLACHQKFYYPLSSGFTTLLGGKVYDCMTVHLTDLHFLAGCAPKASFNTIFPCHITTFAITAG